MIMQGNMLIYFNQADNAGTAVQWQWHSTGMKTLFVLISGGLCFPCAITEKIRAPDITLPTSSA